MKRYISALLVLILLVTMVPTAAFADSNMTAGDGIKTLIKGWEGLRLNAYKAHPSETYWTIGYGHYGPDIYEGMSITEAQANAYFEQDIKAYEKAVNDWNDEYSLKLTQNEFDALVSITYNFGTAWVETYSGWRLTKYLKTGFKVDDLELADAFGVLCSAGGDILPGLLKRRLCEAEMFLYKRYSSEPAYFVSVRLDANGGTLASGNRVAVYYKDKAYGELPAVSRSGYSLNYWLDTETNKPVYNSSIADKSRILKAVWTSGTVPKTYTLTVNGGSGSGSYRAGDTIKLVPSQPPAGKYFTGWTVSGATASKGADGYYYITMPPNSVTVTAVFKDGCALGANCPSKNFTDVPPSFWAHDDIDRAVGAGLFNGITATKFEPDAVMTRAMLVVVLYRLGGNGEDVSDYENPFNDLREDGYYYDAVMWASKHRIANGDDTGAFRPEDPITREELVTLINRYADRMGYPTDIYQDLGSYTDAASVSPWARESMCWALGAGIIKGVTAKTLCPQDEATRAQVATMLIRFAGGML